jgi:hypothetical protein
VFHHLDPDEKLFELSRNVVTRSLRTAREEAAKCALVCANCHAEVESGYVVLSGSEWARLQCAKPKSSAPG